MPLKGSPIPYWSYSVLIIVVSINLCEIMKSIVHIWEGDSYAIFILTRYHEPITRNYDRYEQHTWTHKVEKHFM